MKKTISFILAFVMIFSTLTSFSSIVEGATLQSSWTTGGIKYYGYSDGSAEIGGFESSLSGNVTIPDTSSGYKVKVIRDDAFSGNTKITGITLPTYLSTIGNRSFKGCTKLSSITIPSNVGNIGIEAFADCTSLSSITFSSDNVVVRSNAFNNTSYYNNSSNWSSGVLYIGKYLIAVKSTTSGTVNVKSGTVSLASWGFTDCSSVTNVVIPSTVKYIRQGALDGCTSLTSITLPLFSSVSEPTSSGFTYYTNYFGYIFGASSSDYNASNVPSTLKKVTLISPADTTSTYIPTEFFYNCKYIEEIVLPSNLTKIVYYAFQNCTLLQKISFPQSLKTIERYAFQNCTSLSDISFAGNECLIDRYVFNTTAFYKDASNWDGDELYLGTYFLAYTGSDTSYAVKDGTISIAGVAFYTRTLQQIYIPSSVKIISEYAFSYITALERISVSADNLYYSDYRGILYNKDQTEVIHTPSAHSFILTVNYVDCFGNTIYESVLSKNSADATYLVESPEIPGYYTNDAVISGTMPADDIEITVTYFENTLIASGQCNDTVKWTLYEDGIMIFKGTGDMPDYESGTTPWNSNCEQIKTVYIDPRITKIGDYTFENCINLSYIDFGYSLNSIGRYAFSGCSSLKSIKLPNSVNSISEGAFYGCIGLSSVIISDNITSIEKNAFFGCSQIEKLTIGSSVTFIGENAFSECSSMTQVYFRGAPATLGDNALGLASGKYVYYYSSVSSWNDVISDGVWNGYTAVPYNAISKENFDGTNVYIIKVVDKHNAPLENAVVTLDGYVQSTNKDGMAYFVKPLGSVALSVSCSNHITFEDSDFTSTNIHIMDVIELSDKPSAVQGVRVEKKSIATSAFVLNCNSDKNIEIVVKGYSKYNILKYELYQGSRLISSVETNSLSCIFSVKANSFEEGETVLVKMYTSDGNVVASSLNIDVVMIAEISETQLLEELSGLDLAFSLGDMGDFKLPLSFRTSETEKIYTIINGRTICVGVNIDINEFFDSQKGEITSKTELQKKIDKSLKTFAKGDMGFDANVCGYVEIEYLGNGEYYVKTSYVKIAVSSNLSFNAQASFFGVVGVYFSASLSGETALDMHITHYVAEEGFKIDDMNLSIDNSLMVEGGAYLLWGAGSASIYGKMQMGFLLGIVPDLEFESVYISGELGVKWSVLWGLFRGDHKILSGDIYSWTDSDAYFINEVANSLYDGTYTVNSRDYLEDRSSWLPESEANNLKYPYLQQNIYGGVSPEIVTAGDNTVMVWLDDNAERNDFNFQTLYYSVYQNGVWSSPIPVDDNGTFDCEFHVYTDGKDIYVIFTEHKNVIDDISSFDFSNMDDVSMIINNVEVSFSAFKDGAFTTPVRLTENNACETLPYLSVKDGLLLALWTQTNSAGVNSTQQDSEIYFSFYNGLTWEVPQNIISDQNFISDVSFGMIDGISYTVFVVDADGNTQTTNDKALILVDELYNFSQLDSGIITDISFADIMGSSVLTWCNNSKIYMMTSVDSAPISLLPDDYCCSSGYQIINISGEKTLLVFTSSSYEQSGTDIFGIYVDTEGHNNSCFYLTETEGYIDNFSVSVSGDELIVVFTETFVDVSGENLITTTHLRNYITHLNADIVLSDVVYDITDVVSEESINASLTISNNGFSDIDGITLYLYDSDNLISFSQVYSLDLKSGMTSIIDVQIKIPKILSSGEYNISILPMKDSVIIDDSKMSDNLYGVRLAYSDLFVVAEQKIVGEQNYVILTVSNVGNISTQAIVSVYSPDDVTNILASIETGEIDVGISQQYFIDVSSLTCINDNILCFAVQSLNYEPFDLNNTSVVSLFCIDDSSYTSDPDLILYNPELSVSYVKYDKYSNENVDVEILTESSSFTEISGLIINDNYSFSNNVIILSSTYLNSLSLGTHSLKFIFEFENGSTVERTVTLYINDSSPIVLSGGVYISGEATVGNTLYADISSILPQDSKIKYNWTIDDITVSDTYYYAPIAADIGKELVLTIYGIENFQGEFSDTAVIGMGTEQATIPPVVSKVESTSFTVVSANGVEYSLDKISWQDSSVFENLAPNTTYTVYARRKATDTTFASEPSKGTVVVTLKFFIEAPDFPIVEAKTPTSVTLVGMEGHLYSINGVEWQESNVFVGLSPNTTYVFYQKIAETDTTYESAASIGASLTTPKYTVEKPSAPNVEMRSDTTVTLTYVEGYEYSLDGINWQNESNASWYGHNRFVDLLPATEYSFYCRTSETDTTYASEASDPLVIKTWKSSVSAPPTPSLDIVTSDSITLSFDSQYQYKIYVYTGIHTESESIVGMWGSAEEPVTDNEGWSDSNVFDNLLPNTKYVCQIRYKETDISYASEASDPLYITTNKYTISAPDAPQLLERDFYSITLCPDELAEFMIEGGIWTENNVFDNLSPGKSYIFYKRYKETDTTYASPASASAVYLTVDNTIHGRISIDGNAYLGQELTATFIYFSGNYDSISYQWYSDDLLLEGKTGTTYTVTENDMGKTLKLVVSGTGEYKGTIEAFVTVLDYLPGDVDGNLLVDATDYLRIKSAFLALYTLSDAEWNAADMDKNGVIDATDYLRIKSIFLKQI